MALITFTLVTIFCVNAFAQEKTSPTTTATANNMAEERAEESEYLQRHRPFYFAYGNPLTKIQVSFKTPLIHKFPLFFGYTQQMFWALREESVPFRDSTYNPEFFYRWYTHEWGGIHSIDFGLHNHESNGKAGDDSRSLNSQYVRFNFEKGGSRWNTRLIAQLSYLHSFDPTNRDFLDYVSPLSLNLSFTQLFDGWVDKSTISLQVAPGGKFAQRWDYGGYQLDWSFRVGAIDLRPAFYFQYYHGFAETLLNYNKRIDAFRVGLIF